MAWPLTPVHRALRGYRGIAGHQRRVAAGQERPVSAEQIDSFGGRDSSAYVAYVDRLVQGALVCYAITAFLREASRSIKANRERLEAQRAKGNVSRVLEDISRAFSSSTGISATVDDLFKYSAEPSWYRHTCEQFSRMTSSPDEETASLPDVLREHTHMLAERLLKDEAMTRELFDQFASILSIRESVKAQRRMEALTVVALFVALASLFAALPPVKDWPKTIASLRDAVRAASDQR